MYELGGALSTAVSAGDSGDEVTTGLDTSPVLMSDMRLMAEAVVSRPVTRMSREQSRTLLRREFKAESGTFTRALRSQLTWDREAFAGLVTAMHVICTDYSDQPHLERWLAEGIWQSNAFITAWSGNREFPRTEPDEYYERAWDQLNELAGWFFGGISPYNDEFPFVPVR